MNIEYFNSIIYDRVKKGYRLERIDKMKLKNSEILALCKILLDSRAFTKEEMIDMLDCLIEYCVPKSNQKLIQELIKNEEFYYVEPQHRTKFIDTIWEIGQAIEQCYYIQIEYYRIKDKSIISRKVKPVAIMFSEYYFYLTAFIDDKDEVREHFDVLNDSFSTIYRIDRIRKINVLSERFHIPHSSRCEESEFRKRIQFLYIKKLAMLLHKHCTHLKFLIKSYELYKIILNAGK